jgi:hypothetical protein
MKTTSERRQGTGFIPAASLPAFVYPASQALRLGRFAFPAA